MYGNRHDRPDVPTNKKSAEPVFNPFKISISIIEQGMAKRGVEFGELGHKSGIVSCQQQVGPVVGVYIAAPYCIHTGKLYFSRQFRQCELSVAIVDGYAGFEAGGFAHHGLPEQFFREKVLY